MQWMATSIAAPISMPENLQSQGSPSCLRHLLYSVISSIARLIVIVNSCCVKPFQGVVITPFLNFSHRELLFGHEAPRLVLAGELDIVHPAHLRYTSRMDVSVMVWKDQSSTDPFMKSLASPIAAPKPSAWTSRKRLFFFSAAVFSSMVMQTILTR